MPRRFPAPWSARELEQAFRIERNRDKVMCHRRQKSIIFIMTDDGS